MEEGQRFGCPPSLRSFDLLQAEPITVILQRGRKTGRETVRVVLYSFPAKHTHTCIYACARTHRGIKGSWPLQPMVPILIILCSIPSFELEVLASKNEVKGDIL